MLSNVLVTGSNGFIGKNLLLKIIDNKSINIFKFTRHDSLDLLKEYLIKCDFIFHFAGEVRPNSEDDDFRKSNVLLTQFIVDTLEKENKVIPILLSSTIHAKLLKNEYGKTKRDSELLLENYAKRNNVNCFIYRLPHVFGEGCKVNYNSVLSTWIYNSINNLDINIFDRNIEMNYVYVQDIVQEFLQKLTVEDSTKLYFDPTQIYETSLGEVVDFINEFKLNILDKNYKIIENSFKQKLFQTYSDYYRETDAESK
jgi:UDP-2-acetamido-2,6-beta-L-arabino-hexul-4-ose reductase